MEAVLWILGPLPLLVPWGTRVIREPEESPPTRPAPAHDEADGPMVMIHGDMWKVAHVIDEVRRCRTVTWTAQTWQPVPALVHRSGSCVSLYRGQAFDPEKIDLVPDGWTHEHCMICTHRICDAEGHRDAFTCGDCSWICAECHEQFILNDAAGVG